MIGYLDTSALVKLVVTEPETELVAQAWVDLDPVASTVGYAELRAAVAAVGRRAVLPPPAIDVLRAQAEIMWARVTPVRVSSAVVRLAGALAESHALRALDAIHLASAVQLRERSGTAPVFVTFDRRLAAAARAEGLRVLPAGA